MPITKGYCKEKKQYYFEYKDNKVYYSQEKSVGHWGNGRNYERRQKAWKEIMKYVAKCKIEEKSECTKVDFSMYAFDD